MFWKEFQRIRLGIVKRMIAEIAQKDGAIHMKHTFEEIIHILHTPQYIL